MPEKRKEEVWHKKNDGKKEKKKLMTRYLSLTARLFEPRCKNNTDNEYFEISKVAKGLLALQ